MGERILELLIIRHGQSEADITGVHEGRANFSLTEEGKVQAKKMTDIIVLKYPPDIVMTSPLKRAKETADILQKGVGCELRVEDDLMEYNNGVLAGMSREEALMKYPLPKGGRPFHVPIMGGESMLDLRYRAERIFHKIMLEYADYKRVAVISHGGLISNFMKAFLGLPSNSPYEFATGDTGIHCLRINDNSKAVLFLNNQEHLL